MTVGAASAPRPIERVTVVGTGLMGTSVALAAARAGASVIGWDVDPPTTARAAAVGGFTGAATLEEAVEGAELVVVCTPIPMIADAVAAALSTTSEAIVTEVGSIMDSVAKEVAERADPAHLRRFVPGHPMGGASAPVGCVRVRARRDRVGAVGDGMPARGRRVVEAWVSGLGARPVRMPADRHDRLVAFVTISRRWPIHGMMSLAASEEADEPEILLLAAGGSAT